MTQQRRHRRHTQRQPTALTAGLVALGVVAALGRPAWAQDPPPVDYYTNSPLLLGSDVPRLEITTSERLESVQATLRRGSRRFEESIGELSRGNPAQLTFESPVGRHRWQVELEGMWRGEPFSLSFDFEFEVSEGLELTVPLDRVDLEAHELTVVLNRPAARIDYSVMGDDGNNLGNGSVAFAGERAGTPLRVPWSQQSGTVLKIVLTAYDVDGFWAEVELIPWSYNIPHEEVHFATGSDVIEEDQQPKIDDAFRQAMEAVRRYGEFVEVRLYVAGYTDTVGSAADNQDLSDRRAHSIARAFRQRGFDFPIFYQGFGESVLAVPTPDSTDEIRNRRALYILAAQPPLPSSQIPRANWRPID